MTEINNNISSENLNIDIDKQLKRQKTLKITKSVIAYVFCVASILLDDSFIIEN